MINSDISKTLFPELAERYGEAFKSLIYHYKDEFDLEDIEDTFNFNLHNIISDICYRIEIGEN